MIQHFDKIFLLEFQDSAGFFKFMKTIIFKNVNDRVDLLLTFCMKRNYVSSLPKAKNMSLVSLFKLFEGTRNREV